MIKEIALRKLASDEGINPYGVGALGAAGLTTIGYTPLYDRLPIGNKLSKKLDKARNLEARIHSELIRRKNEVKWNESELAKARVKLQKDEQWVKKLRGDDGDIFNWLPDAEARLKKTKKEVADLADSINKSKGRIPILQNRHGRVKGMSDTLWKKYYKVMKPAGIATRIVAPIAALGLGGKYLYDKLKD